MEIVKKYHPLLVGLHWFLAILIILLLANGNLMKTMTHVDDPQKIMLLKAHLIAGFMVLFLMISRLIVRLKSDKPEPMDTGSTFKNKLGKYSHIFLYVVVFGALGSGIATSILGGVPDVAFFGSGDIASLDNLDDVPTKIFHTVWTWILLGMIILHFSAAMYHQLIRKDGLMSRMWFGKRK
jgi:cytochrome b561